jgi:hypothetical protein
MKVNSSANVAKKIAIAVSPLGRHCSCDEVEAGDVIFRLEKAQKQAKRYKTNDGSNWFVRLGDENRSDAAGTYTYLRFSRMTLITTVWRVARTVPSAIRIPKPN